jgi:hypothetical protein
MALGPATHRIYLPCADFETNTNKTNAGAQRGRPAMIPDTFKILVYGMDKS